MDKTKSLLGSKANGPLPYTSSPTLESSSYTYVSCSNDSHPQSTSCSSFQRQVSANLDDKGIPNELLPAEKGIYRTIQEAVGNRTRPDETPNVVVITDIGTDYDDLAALIVLKELHRLGAIQLKGVITNLLPAAKRAHLGRRSLNLLGLEEIAVAEGTDALFGQQDNVRKHVQMDYNFPAYLMGPEPFPTYDSGYKLLRKICEAAEKEQEKLTFLLISSLTDIHMFQMEHSNLLEKVTAKVVMQGGYINERKDRNNEEEHLIPEKAANNNFDMPAAKKFHSFLRNSPIPSVVYTRDAAYANPLSSDFFSELSTTQHRLGIALKEYEARQNIEFYTKSCSSKPFLPGLDQQWFLKNRSTYWETHAPETDPEKLPKGEEILPYVKVVVYDALAALGTAGDDVIDALGILLPPSKDPRSTAKHRIIGVPALKAGSRANLDEEQIKELEKDIKEHPNDYTAEPGTNPEKMASVVETLMKGSLLESL